MSNNSSGGGFTGGLMNSASGFFSNLVIMLFVAIIFFLFFLNTVPEYSIFGVFNLRSAYEYFFYVVSGLLLIKVIQFPKYFIIMAVGTAPFWLVGMANSFFVETFKVDPEMVGSIALVASPAIIALSAFIYQQSTRWQEFSRTFVQPIALVVHALIIVYAVITGQVTPIIMAWALGAFSITLFVNSFVNNDTKDRFLKASTFTIVASIALFILG